jgi:hypothetical protein
MSEQKFEQKFRCLVRFRSAEKLEAVVKNFAGDHRTKGLSVVPVKGLELHYEVDLEVASIDMQNAVDVATTQLDGQVSDHGIRLVRVSHPEGAAPLAAPPAAPPKYCPECGAAAGTDHVESCVLKPAPAGGGE